MADKKITELSEFTSATGDDLLVVVDNAGTPETKKITKTDFLNGVAPTNRTVLASNATVVASALANISGMSLAVSAGGIYRFESMLVLNRTSAAALYGYGLTFPHMANIRGTYYIATSASQTTLGTASVVGGRVIFTGDSASGSTLVSTISTARLSTYAKIEAVMNVSANGVVQLQAKTSSGTAPLVVIAGSFMEVIRLN